MTRFFAEVFSELVPGGKAQLIMRTKKGNDKAPDTDGEEEEEEEEGGASSGAAGAGSKKLSTLTRSPPPPPPPPCTAYLHYAFLAVPAETCKRY